MQQGKAYQQEAESVKFDLQDRRNAVRAQAQREKERAEQGPQKLQQQRAAAAAVAAAAARRPAGRAAEPKPKAKPVEDDDVVEILDSDDEVRCSCTGGAGLMGFTVRIGCMHLAGELCGGGDSIAQAWRCKATLRVF